MSADDRLVVAATRLCTCAGGLGAIDDGAVAIEHGRVAAVGPRAEVLARFAGARIVEHQGVVTPGLVDAHTHAPWVGSRDREYAMRMAGADYEAIAAAGGGIVSSMRAVRAATRAEIASVLRARLARMAALGVTTVEAKSGYGLDEVNETKQLEAVADAAAADLPRVVPTYLALHALPPEANGDRDTYARDVLERTLPAIAGAGLCRFVDAYVDRSAFSVTQAGAVLAAARTRGLGVRIHAGQFADVGAAELAADLGAASADHLEEVSAAGIERLVAAGVAAVLLPIAAFTLRQAPPPIEALRRAGATLVVASDANPGTAPTESLPLAIALAVRAYGLTVEEALLGATAHAAASLGLTGECGALAPGFAADLVAWDLPSEAAIIQPWGAPRTRFVLREGRPIAGSLA